MSDLKDGNNYVPETLVLDDQDVSQLAHVKGKKVLIVEDDTFLGGILFRYMQKNQVEAVQAKSAEEAFGLIQKSVPDIITLDIFLPGINGLEFLEKLRKDAVTANVPVLAVSNTGEREYRERVKKLGASFFVKAVVTPDIILNELERMLSGKVV